MTSVHSGRPVGATLETPLVRPVAAPAPTPRAASRERKVGHAHFAFMRSLVEGLDEDASWERYLTVEGDSGDPRVVRSTIAWLRHEFALAAKKHDRFGTARLLRIDATKIADKSLQLPSLEDFAQDRGLEEYSEADQIDAYEQEFGKASARQNRRAALVARQLTALKWLEDLIAQPPRAGDSVCAWFHPSLAQHLEGAGLFTIAQLVERINGIGRRWHASIKAMGPGKGARIVAWLRDNEATLNQYLGRHVDVARSKLFTHELAAVVQASSEIRPLEKFVVPAELDGRAGLYRRPQAQCLLKATHDYQAILAWLQAKHGMTPAQKAHASAHRAQRSSGVEQAMDWLQFLSNTQRAYRKEAERFLLWAVVQRQKPLSSMTNEDCVAYRDFLADPQPASRWCGARSRPRWSPLWRPFEGPLSASAQGHAITILKNLYGFLVDQNYLMGNPWAAVSVPRGAAPKVNAGRSFTRAQWQFIAAQADMLVDTSANKRLKFALRLLYATGLRLSEVVAATVDDLSWVEYPSVDEGETLQGWLLQVIGKGNKLREVPLPNEVVEELKDYLQSRRLSREPGDIGNQGAHLLGKASDISERAPRLAAHVDQDPRGGLAASTLYNQFKSFFGDCASVLRHQGDGKGAERFDKASSHWLRHTHASHAIASGMPIEIAQQNLGHASLATTTIYLTTEQRRRMQAVQGFWAAASPASTAAAGPVPAHSSEPTGKEGLP
jgi:site-specific recombinase XerD